jgi:hypothetical protein
LNPTTVQRKDGARAANTRVRAGRGACRALDDEKEWLAQAHKEAKDAFAELDRGESIRGTPMELMVSIDAEVARQAGV